MKIEQVVRRAGKLTEYEKVYYVTLTKKEINIHGNKLKSEIKHFVDKNVAAKWIDITPIYWANNKPMITVTLTSQNRLLFIIDNPINKKTVLAES